MTSGNDGTGVADDGDKARSGWREPAILISIASFVISLFAVYFTYLQANETRRTNDISEMTQAQNVFVDSSRSEPISQRRVFIRNRNPAPISNVYYKYQVAGAAVDAIVTVGPISPCTSVELMPRGDESKTDFIPTEIYFTDSTGHSWRRDISSQQIYRVDKITRIPDPRESRQHIEEISPC